MKSSSWSGGEPASSSGDGSEDPKAGDQLPESIVDLIVRTTEGLGAASELIERQARAARVVRFSATDIDVVVPQHSESIPLANGPITSYGILDEAGSVVGQVLIWVSNGMFIGMEQDWYTEETPSNWPLVQQIGWGS